MTTADIIPLGAAMRFLRGADAELTRLAWISLRRRAAYRRAVAGEYEDSDVAMFGAADLLLAAGPEEIRPIGGPSAA